MANARFEVIDVLLNTMKNLIEHPAIHVATARSMID
jgi:hypothetical protein